MSQQSESNNDNNGLPNLSFGEKVLGTAAVGSMLAGMLLLNPFTLVPTILTGVAVHELWNETSKEMLEWAGTKVDNYRYDQLMENKDEKGGIVYLESISKNENDVQSVVHYGDGSTEEITASTAQRYRNTPQ